MGRFHYIHYSKSLYKCDIESIEDKQIKDLAIYSLEACAVYLEDYIIKRLPLYQE